MKNGFGLIGKMKSVEKELGNTILDSDSRLLKEVGNLNCSIFINNNSAAQ
jgi:hypothetical protein